MFHNLYPVSSTGYMNLGKALFLHDLISDEEIDICAHIFHLLCKTVLRTDSRACIPFCYLISRILKLKGVHPSDNESPYPKQSLINIRTLNASIGHSQKGIKMESSAPPMVPTLPHPPMMRNWITLWYPSTTLAPRCPGLLLSCTITTSVVI